MPLISDFDGFAAAYDAGNVQVLRQALVVARAEGVDRVLVTTDDANAASQAVITRCGGEYCDTRVDSAGQPVRRYWID